jgi:succinyl-CoA synthetase beta subunit
MLLLEADGKRLFDQAGIAVPPGVLMDASGMPEPLPGAGPWIAKAQVPVGGRGKAGGVLPVASARALPAVLARLIGLRIKGKETREVLVEAMCEGTEQYLAVLVDAGAGGVRLLYSPSGGMEVESHAAGEGGFNELVPLDRAALHAAARRLAASAPASQQAGLQDVAQRLVDVFLDRELLLAEINPLFARSDGGFVAGDAKVVIDMSAMPRQPGLRGLLEARREHYPDAWRKLSEDLDFVEIDPHGEVGLVTTGAGLSMMLIDELVAQGLRPFNFCDMRTGQMRGSPVRLVRIFEWLAAAPDIRVVLVNIFAGITDLAEFSQLLVDALRARGGMRQPIVARLVGNGEEAARQILAANADLRIYFEPDLDRAVARVAQLLQAAPAAPEASHVA